MKSQSITARVLCRSLESKIAEGSDRLWLTGVSTHTTVRGTVKFMLTHMLIHSKIIHMLANVFNL